MKNNFAFELMQFIDHWVGLPICYAVGVLTKLINAISSFIFFGKHKPAQKEPKTILILKWFGLGSVILMRDLVGSIRKKYPEAKIIFLTFEGIGKLVDFLSFADEIVAIRKSNPLIFIIGTFKVLFICSFRKIDIAIDLEFYSKFSTLMTYLSGAPVRVGFYLPAFWRKSLYTNLVYFNYFKHIQEIYKMAGKAIGIEVEEARHSIKEIPFEDISFVKEKLKELGWNGSDRLIGINANAGELAYCRRWPKEYFIEVISKLSNYDGFAIVLIGALEDKEHTDIIYNSLKEKVVTKVINSAGIFTLPQFIALLYLLSFLITNDSGPLHFAVILNIPTISIWGPGTPLLYGSPDKTIHKEFYSNVPCSPCMYIYRTRAGYFCNNEAFCLKRILPDEVIEYAYTLMKKV